MKQKSSFLIYHEYREPLKLLTDEQRGQLLMALIDYSESGVVPELDGISMMELEMRVRLLVFRQKSPWLMEI